MRHQDFNAHSQLVNAAESAKTWHNAQQQFASMRPGAFKVTFFNRANKAYRCATIVHARDIGEATAIARQCLGRNETLTVEVA